MNKMKTKSEFKPNKLTKTQFEKFFVGLIEGDGSLQVNHWKYKNLQYRIVIKLSNKPLNYEILINVKKNFGGTILIIKNNKNQEFVQWTVNNKENILNTILPIFKKYPPLTSRTYFQLKFIINCLNHNNITIYINTKKDKYKEHNKEFKLCDTNNIPNYFKEWLARIYWSRRIILYS
uniref:LAGLIDADG homing endonuclease n=1 Tax=Malassezia vespertilionis TaxID=2020962 RepID=UPI003002550E|nr:LAGLIDADG homing endonuclease [Malassezia vespertilionis]